jgi:hypothetical protein
MSFGRIMIACIIAVLFSLAAATPFASAQNALTTEQWRQDLHYLAARIPLVHRDAFHDVSKGDFDTAVAGLDKRLPQLSDQAVVVEFTRLVAMLREGHSRLSLPGLPDPMSDSPEITPAKYPQLDFQRLPVKMYSFSDGLFIVAATPDFSDLIGAQVLQIGDHPVQDVIRAVVPIVNRDNEMGTNLLGPEFVALPDVLQSLQLISDASRVSLRCRTIAGRDVTVKLAPVRDGDKPRWLQVYESTRISSPLYLHHPEKNLWFEYLEDSKTEFVRINKIQNTPDESVAGFANRLYADIRSRQAERVVIDLRDCHGGDNQLFRPLLLGLIREQRVDHLGRLFVITGRATFSAAVNAAVDLERLSNAIFVGEPPAGAPNSWGDPKPITLPNSGLIVRISTIYWRDWTTDQSRSQMAPDIPVMISSADYFSGADPSLKAILAFPRQTTFSDVLENVTRAGGGLKSIIRLYYRQKTDPLSADESTQVALERLVGHLVSTKSYEEALIIIKINSMEYPNSLSTVIQRLREAQEAEPNNVVHP